MAVNLGHRCIYNFYFNNDLNKKIPSEIVESWFPKTATEAEYKILFKINELANNKDEINIPLKNDIHTISLYITYEPEQFIDKNGKLQYRNDQREIQKCCIRAKKRFGNLKARNLLSGDNYKLPAITILGKQKLENKNDNIDELKEILHEIINVLYISYKSSNETILKLEDIEKNLNNNSNIKDILDKTNTACTIIQTIPILSNSINLGIKYLPRIQNFINNTLNAIGI